MRQCLYASTRQHVLASIRPSENVFIRQRLNASTRRRVNASEKQRLNASARQRVNATTRHRVNMTTHLARQCVNVRGPRRGCGLGDDTGYSNCFIAPPHAPFPPPNPVNNTYAYPSASVFGPLFSDILPKPHGSTGGPCRVSVLGGDNFVNHMFINQPSRSTTTPNNCRHLWTLPLREHIL